MVDSITLPYEKICSSQNKGPTQTCSLNFNMWLCCSTFERTMASLVFLRSDPCLSFSYCALYNWHIVCKVHSLIFLVFLAGISLLQVPGNWMVDTRTGELGVSLPRYLSWFQLLHPHLPYQKSCFRPSSHRLVLAPELTPEPLVFPPTIQQRGISAVANVRVASLLPFYKLSSSNTLSPPVQIKLFLQASGVGTISCLTWM